MLNTHIARGVGAGDKKGQAWYQNGDRNGMKNGGRNGMENGGKNSMENGDQNSIENE